MNGKKDGFCYSVMSDDYSVIIRSRGDFKMYLISQLIILAIQLVLCTPFFVLAFGFGTINETIGFLCVSVIACAIIFVMNIYTISSNHREMYVINEFGAKMICSQENVQIPWSEIKACGVVHNVTAPSFDRRDDVSLIYFSDTELDESLFREYMRKHDKMDKSVRMVLISFNLQFECEYVYSDIERIVKKYSVN